MPTPPDQRLCARTRAGARSAANEESATLIRCLVAALAQIAGIAPCVGRMRRSVLTECDNGMHQNWQQDVSQGIPRPGASRGQNQNRSPIICGSPRPASAPTASADRPVRCGRSRSERPAPPMAATAPDSAAASLGRSRPAPRGAAAGPVTFSQLCGGAGGVGASS